MTERERLADAVLADRAGAEPPGCPTPGACSCTGEARAAATAKGTVRHRGWYRAEVERLTVLLGDCEAEANLPPVPADVSCQEEQFYSKVFGMTAPSYHALTHMYLGLAARIERMTANAEALEGREAEQEALEDAAANVVRAVNAAETCPPGIFVAVEILAAMLGKPL